MNFFVINASPKTRHSITLQHLYFLEQQYPQHRFEMVHAANQIPVYEKTVRPCRNSWKQSKPVMP